MGLLLYNLLGVKPNGFGLEIENRSIKALMIRKGRKGKQYILSCGMRPLRKGIVQDGQILDSASLALEIKELIRTAKPSPIKSRAVVFSVPENKSFIRTIQIPKMTREEAEEAIRWETEANIPIAVDKVYLDWQVIGEEKGKDEILVAAVPREIVENYSKAVGAAGLDILAIEADIIATIRGIANGKDFSKEPVVIVDLGNSLTTLAVSKNEVPYFTSTLLIGGSTFTDALQKSLGVSYEKAEDLKLKYGLGKMKEDDVLYEAYNPIIENLIEEIEKSIRFYEESINSKEKVQKIFLSGGGALMRDLSDYLSLRMKKEVVVGDPIQDMILPGNFSEEIRKSLSPFATAIGLAKRAVACDD